MEAAMIIGIVAFFAMIVWSIFALNSHCASTYGYRPFSVGNGFFALAVLILLGAAMFVADSANHDPTNVQVLLGTAAIVFAGMLVNIVRHTSVLIGIYSSILLIPTCVVVLGLVSFVWGRLTQD